MTEPAKKDLWDKTEIIGKIVLGILVPTIAAIALWDWNNERTEQTNRTRMTEIALGILSKDINEAEVISSAEVALRGWAFDTINSVSEIRLPEQSRQALVNGQVSIRLISGAGLFDLPIVFEAMTTFGELNPVQFDVVVDPEHP